MPTCRGVRSNTRWATPLVIALVLSTAGGPMGPSATIKAQAPIGAGFKLDAADLRFIYQQIVIAEQHVATGQINLPDPRLPWGLRTVDGSFNHLGEGQTLFGASNQVFPRMTAPSFRAAEAGTTYDSNANVNDSTPRLISNLIVDQTESNPAAVIASQGATPDASGTLFIPAVAPDVGLSAPMNTMFVFFGQFFDHGLDLLDRGNRVVAMPLRPDDPLIAGPDGVFGNGDDLPPPLRVMMITRGFQVDAARNIRNRTTPFVDQNQTYTSHPSHQVYLREYKMVTVDGAPRPADTGRFLDGHDSNGVPNGNIATWADVKLQTAEKLGIALVDTDVLNIPLLLTDLYGNFVPGTNGFPQLVTTAGLVEGNPSSPISTTNAVRVGHAFLDDIAHNAVPDGDYDASLLNDHFLTGDGRGNENIALTAVHTVFHSEHNRLANEIGGVNGTGGLIDTLLTPEEAAAWRSVDSAAGWDYGKRVFQAARFVTEMEYQHLVFEEFGRTISPSINEFIGDGINFQTQTNPAITAEFAHAVYRFGHSMLTETISRTLPDGTIDDMPLLQGFLNPRAFNIVNGQELDAAGAAGAIFQGGVRQVANEIDEFKTEALRNQLLGLPLDLAAINIARGRSEGVATLNRARAQIYQATTDPIMRPYESWADFGFSMRFPESLANFVAAYGTHSTITSQTTIAGRRAAAMALIDAGDAWLFAPAAETGLDDVDLWMGGLAEKPSPFGGLLGSTFNHVFEAQLENLQNADRFYYLERLDGLNLLAQLEGNSFAEIIGRNTTATGLPQLVFARPDLVFNLDKIDGGFDPETNKFLIIDDPTTPDDESNLRECENCAAQLIRMPDGTFRYTGPAHVIWNGKNDPVNGDKAFSSEGDDTFNGGAGNDRFEGSTGNDSPVGGEGDDVLTDAFGEDVMKGGPGNDAIAGGPGLFDLLQGNEGDDFVVGGNDVSEVFGGHGDDVIFTGDGATESFGGYGDDWLESGHQLNLLVGDENNQFQNDPTGGHDVIIGGRGDDDFDAEGGDDIMIAGVPGTDRLEGMLGYDWAIYARDTIATDADMLLVGEPTAPTPNELRDRYDLTEGLSGTRFGDALRGDDRAAADLAIGAFGEVADGHVLTNAGIDRITGLRALLPEGATEFRGGNIILGGGGSDILEGRGGDDIIDGDRWLNTQLVATLTNGTQVRANSLHELRGRVFANPQTLNPGSIDIDRFIETVDVAAGDIDVAVFTGPRADYTISTLADGSITVAHLGGTGSDGTDKLWRVERLQFADMTVSTVGGGAISVPNLFGMTEAQARGAIAALGLNVGTVDLNGVHPTQAIGNVVDQSPLAGVGVGLGSTVSFVVTRGALVPDIHESTVSDGTDILVAGGFVVSGTTNINDPEIPSGLVASTNPVAGEVIAPGSSVIINVSLGPVAAGRVPAVAGLPREDAEEAILNAGYALPAQPRFEASATIPAGSVIRTQPAAGLARAAGTVITPFVSTGADGLVLALGFDEAGGTIAVDSSITGLDGTFRQATMQRAAGRFGNAVVFNGTNNWITIADTTNSPLDLTTTMTIEAWIRPTSASGWDTVVMKERAGGLAYALYSNDGAPLAEGVAAPAGYNRTTTVGLDSKVTGTGPIALNVWSHLAMTYDGVNQRLYINGALVATSPLNGPNIVNNNAFRIGGNNQFPGEFFQGMIDEVRVYSTVRTEAQIQADMNRPINP